MFPSSLVWWALGYISMGFALAPFSKLKHDPNTYLMLKYERAGAETSHTSALPVQDIPQRGSQGLSALPAQGLSPASCLSTSGLPRDFEVQLWGNSSSCSSPHWPTCLACFLTRDPLFFPLLVLLGDWLHEFQLALQIPPLGVSSCCSFHLVSRLPSLKAMTTRAVSPPHPIAFLSKRATTPCPGTPSTSCLD
jgi:hypothetical protein